MAKESRGQAASKKQLIMVGVAFAVLLGVVYFMFLRGGGEEPASAIAPAPAPAEQTAPAEDESSDKNEAQAPKKKSKGPVETSEVFGGKDPFEPVLDLTPEAAAAGDASTETVAGTTDGTVATTDDGTTTTPIAPTAPATTPTPTPPPPDDDDEVKTGFSVKLLKIYNDGGTRTALVETVNRESRKKMLHELVAGERFRRYFKLTSMDNNCASFLFAEEWFALCEGQRTIRK